jgi:hypothetical protein
MVTPFRADSIKCGGLLNCCLNGGDHTNDTTECQTFDRKDASLSWNPDFSASEVLILSRGMSSSVARTHRRLSSICIFMFHSPSVIDRTNEIQLQYPSSMF